MLRSVPRFAEGPSPVIDNRAAPAKPAGAMKLPIPSLLAVLALSFPVYANDAATQRKAAEAEREAAAAARKAADAERKAEAVRKAEIKSLKQEVRALQSQKTTGAKEYGDKVRAINAKQDVIRAKERQ